MQALGQRGAPAIDVLRRSGRVLTACRHAADAASIPDRLMPVIGRALAGDGRAAS